MMEVSEIAELLNAQAATLVRDLLPNGQASGNYWLASGIEDNGKGTSLYVHLSGPKIGRWRDMGNAAPGEEHGDMLDLLRLVLGLADVGAAIAEAKVRGLIEADEWTPHVARLDPVELERRAQATRERAAKRQAEDDAARAQKTRRAVQAWLSGAPIAGTPAEYYLQNRGLSDGGEWPGTLRYHAEMWCQDISVKVPAMLAQIFRADGDQIGTHRIYLELDQREGWRKLDVAQPKKVLGSFWGGFVPINKGSSGKPMARMPEGEAVYVTEGIEDAICVRMIRPEARIVAAVSLGNIGAIVLPPAARKLVIVCDRDDKPKAIDQLERVIAQQQARGLEVLTVMPPDEVNGRRVKDVNDWLRALNAPVRRGRVGSAAA